MTLYAKWDVEKIQVTKKFETADGSSLKANVQVNINLGTTFNDGPDSITGYIYQGYKTDNGSLVPSTAGPNITPQAAGIDITVTYVYNVAQYTLTYNHNASTSGSVPANRSYNYNEDVTVSDQGNLLKDNHTFLGWATNSSATVPDKLAGSAFKITTDTTLYAVWKANNANVKYVVTYQPGAYGTFSAQSTGNLSLGDTTPSAPKATAQFGWSFTGWSPMAPSLTVTGNAIYVAQWTRNLYTVQFVDWNGTLINSQQVAYGGDATEPTNPTRSGYTFIGWNRAYTNVQANVTVTALYRVIPAPPRPDLAPDLYTVLFVNWDGSILNTQQVSPGDDAMTPNNPTRAGYIFTTWDSAYSNVQSDITVTALYDEVVVNDPTPELAASNTTNTAQPTQKGTPSQVHRQETLQIIKESGLPVLTIGNNEIPLVGLPGMMVWALTNLILCTLGILFAIITTRRLLQRKKGHYTANTMERYRGKNTQLLRKQHSHVTLVIATVMGLLGIIVFMITENMTNLMVLVDQWTFINAVIFAVEITALVLSSKNMKKNDRVVESEESFTELFGQ